MLVVYIQSGGVNAVQYDMILHTALLWLKYYIGQSVNSQQTPHTLPSRASYGVSIVRIWEKIDRVYKDTLHMAPKLGHNCGRTAAGTVMTAKLDLVLLIVLGCWSLSWLLFKLINVIPWEIMLQDINTHLNLIKHPIICPLFSMKKYGWKELCNIAYHTVQILMGGGGGGGGC